MIQQKKHSVFLFIGIGFAFIFALIWSIDGAIAWLTFGLTCAAFVLHWKVNSNWINNTIEPEQEEEVSLEELLKEVSIKQTTKDGNQSPQQKQNFKKVKPIEIQDVVKKILSSIGYIVIGIIVFVFGFAIISGDDSEEAFENLSAEELVIKGDNSYTYSDYDSASYYYSKAKEKNPNYPGVWLGLGNLKYANNEIDSALIYYQKSVSIDARFSAGRYNMAWWHYSQKNYSEAISRLISLTKDEPNNGQALQLLGDAYYDQKDFNNSFTWYEKAYQADYKNGWLCHVLGYLYDTRNQTNKAIELYKEAVYYNPDNADVYVRLGELLPGAEGEEYRKKAAELKK